MGVFCKRKLECSAAQRLLYLADNLKKNNMFSCDLRLDYLIFSLWCYSTSNHLLNGWNRYDHLVQGPWCSCRLSNHALPGASIHSCGSTGKGSSSFSSSDFGTKQDPMGPSQDRLPTHILGLPLIYRETLAS